VRVGGGRAGRTGAREADKSGAAKEGGKAAAAPFIEQLSAARERANREALDQYLGALDDAAGALAKNPTRENLDRYKALLQKFMQGAVALTFSTNKQQVFNRKTGFETRVVHKIDEAVKQLTEEVLAKNRRPMRILEKIGEIRGLLVDALL